MRYRVLRDLSRRRQILEQRSRAHRRLAAATPDGSFQATAVHTAEAIDLVELYLKVWRTILCSGKQTPFLFPGDPPDRHKGKGALSSQIKEVVYAYTRLDMPAHRFRHAVGKIYLDRNPGKYEIVRLLLGHKDINTTIAFYTGAESASAARHYHRTILGIRNGSFDGGALP